MTKRKSEEKLEPFLEGQEFSVAADKLIAAVEHWYLKIKGVNPTREQLHEIACQVVRSRK